MKMNWTDRYSIEPGRNIYRDGKPFIAIRPAANTAFVEADAVTHVLCMMLNNAVGEADELQRIEKEGKAL